ncbi:dynamin family protein [Paenibacillus sp. 2TAF8]|uniref:dynamin family protein n=1 Tax=Paenibacillus sp. 2TAF8 TaxID=3233020 RepID=UPI003F97BB00
MTKQQLVYFEQKRDQVIQVLGEIKRVAELLNVSPIVDLLTTTTDDLKNQRFKVVVVGEFSRGKSTFINGLLGKRILPSSPVPTTTILNKIVYAEAPTYTLVFRDANRIPEIVSEDAFKAIVAPDELFEEDEDAMMIRNEQLERITNIAYAEIGYPTEICCHGVEIVDTPGTNDLDAAREEITYRFIPQSDASIILLSGKMPLAQTEMNFIRDRIIASDIKKLFFVINFKDALKTESDQNKVIQYIDTHLRTVVSNPRIFMLSAKQALSAKRRLQGETVKGQAVPLEETGYPEFEVALSKFLAEEQGKIKLLKPAERGIRMVEELKRNHIRLLVGMMSLNMEQLEQQLAQIRSELERARASSNKTLKSLEMNLMTSGIKLREEFVNSLHEIANSAVQTITNYQGALDNDEIARAVENIVAPLQTELQARLKALQTKWIQEELERANRKLLHEWDAIETKIVDSLSFGVDVSGDDLQRYQTQYDESEIAVKTGLGSLSIFGLIATFHIAIPIAVPALFFGGSFLYTYFQNKMRDRMLGEARVLIEKRYRDGIPLASSSFDEQWRKLTDQVVQSFQDEMNLRLDSMIQRLDQIEYEYGTEKYTVEARKQELTSYLSVLEKCEEMLQGIAVNLEIE